VASSANDRTPDVIKIDFSNWSEWDRERKQFVVGEDSFADLEFNPRDDGSGFHWFYDRARSRLVTEFVLDRTPQTLTYCEVKLIAKGDMFEPRLFLKKDALTNKRWEQAQEQVENNDTHLLVKAAVDLSKAHENFWRLVRFLTSFDNIAVPGERLPIVVADEQVAGLVQLLKDAQRGNVLEAVRVATGGDLTESDFRLLRDRKAALKEFELLLQPDYVQDRVGKTNARGEEDVWQAFFEEHPWIFGYGLKLIAAEGLKEKLEQTTTGATVFDPTGDRVDALMATKGLIQSLMFTEIKTASTKLLAAAEYRSGVYRPSSELSGAVSQVQTTAHRAIRMLEDLHRPTDREGWSQEAVGTIRPRQVVLVGTLSEFRRDDDVNRDRYRSFELYRRSIADVEIITFDELLARSRFIAQHDETADLTGPGEAPAPT
jgi:hypothetical protein